mmetsp:Transcript_14506/g.21384  ORF Transcript_14506/g.21384 Transcript_14506/m.21384 type:complete len:391 (-) Transcript_14506:72-1244(-)
MTSRKSEAIPDVESQPLLLQDEDDDHDNKKKKRQTNITQDTTIKSSIGKKIVVILLFIIIFSLIYDVSARPPEERVFIRPDMASKFLLWVQDNPYWGLGAFLWVIAICVVLLIPIGTPLTLGCGYIYKGVYGWTLGLAVATLVSMAGSALGAVLCFLLGRYLMRDRVRQWVRKYPLFDAIDMAVSEHGLRIMAMLYLTPVLPLGPVSYMCGSTSMALSSFVLAKIASLPLMLLYVYLGATAGTLFLDTEAVEHNLTLMISGLLLSVCMIGGITYTIRNMLMTILEKQQSKISHTTNANNSSNDTKLAVAPHSDGIIEPSPESNNSAAASATTTATTHNKTTDLELPPVVASPSSNKKPLKQRHVMGFTAPNFYSAAPKSGEEIESPSKDK